MSEEERLSEIRARCEMATPGPWLLPCYGAWIYEAAADGSFGRPLLNIYGEEANVRFIAHSREDIPYLLNLIAVKDEEIERLKEACGRCPAHAKLEAEVDEIMSEPDAPEKGDCDAS